MQPNYEKYTLEELLEAKAGLDSERFPERLISIEKLISRKTEMASNLGKENKSNNANESLFKLCLVVAILLTVFLSSFISSSLWFYIVVIINVCLWGFIIFKVIKKYGT